MQKSRRRYRRHSRGLGQAGGFMLFIENTPDLVRKKGAAATALVEQACRGRVSWDAAANAFRPVVAEVTRRRQATAGQAKDLLNTLIEDFKRDVDSCIDSPFCPLPPAAEKALTSTRCLLRRA